MNTRSSFMLVVALAGLALVGCNKEDMSAARNDRAAAEAREQAERQRRLDAERARAEAEQHAQAEQELRLVAEKQASDAATTKWAWIAVVAFVGTVAGVAIRKKVTADYFRQKRGT